MPGCTPDALRVITFGNFEFYVEGLWRRCRGSYMSVDVGAMLWLERAERDARDPLTQMEESEKP